MPTLRLSPLPFCFCLFWLVLLVWPTTRSSVLFQWNDRFVASQRDNSSNSWLYGDSGSDEEETKPEVGFRVPDLPDDRDALVANAMTGNSRTRGRNFEELGRKFPNDASICAMQVVAHCNDIGLGKVRQAGPASNSDPNWSVRLQKLEPVDPQLLKSWFSAVARGQKLEPNNVFWDWMQILGLLAARRNADVWPVLKVGAKKTDFDDHTNDSALATINTRRRLEGRVSTIEQVSIMSAVLFPHFAPMRESARQISENAWGLRLQGGKQNEKTGLEGMRDLMQISRIMHLRSRSSIGALVGQAMETIALSGGYFRPGKPLRRPRLGATVNTYQSSPFSLYQWAKSQSRADIMAQTNQEWSNLSTWRRRGGALFSTTLEGLATVDVIGAAAGDFVGKLLFGGLASSLLVAFVSTLLLRFVPYLRTEKVNLKPASWVGGSLLSLFALLLIAAPQEFAAYRSLFTPTFGGGLDFLIAVYEVKSSVNIVAWPRHFPALFLLIVALWLTVGWARRQQGRASLLSRLKRMFEAPDDGLTRFDFAPLLSLALWFAAIVGIVSMLLAFLLVPLFDSNFASIHEYAGLILFACVVVCGTPALLRLRARTSLTFAIHLARRFVWAHLLLASILFGMLLAFSLPAQKRFDKGIQRLLTVGEFQLARKRIGL